MECRYMELQTNELYTRCAVLIKDTVRETQQNIRSIKKFLGDRKKEINKQIRMKKNEVDVRSLESTRDFFKYIVKELLKIEKSYEEYVLRSQIELLASTMSRMHSFHSPVKEVKKAYELLACCGLFDEAQSEETCGCLWKNTPKWNLEDTRNILLKPKKVARSEFDESDTKFKQEIIILRTKMFALPKNLERSNEDITEPTSRKRYPSIRVSLKANEFIEILKKQEAAVIPTTESELSTINHLKFSDGKFTTCEIWLRILDDHPNHFGSKWYLILCPQIEKILKKRLVRVIHLCPYATYNFISEMERTGENFVLVKDDLIRLLKNKQEAIWLESWKLQFQILGGENIAATLIQAFWRGYWLRKRKRESDRLYIATSVLWFHWIALKKKRITHERYLTKMLMSLQATRELSLKLCENFDSIMDEPHVVLHLTSIGQPVDMRRSLDPKMFTILQNMQCLRISFAHNPKSEVIYISPVKCTQDLLIMYSDLIESISPEEDVMRRITFIALSEAETFKMRSLNVSRILHCSQDTLDEITKRISGKSAYFLPWIVDECDMRLAGNLGVPLLSPDMELQRQFLNMSRMSETIDNLGLLQPPYARDIKDYSTLCEQLSQLIILHTEICSWWIKLNYAIGPRHHGVFLINHISIPFMIQLREEREKHGKKWKDCPNLWTEYLTKLKEHLPKVVSNVTQLPTNYDSWKDFSFHIQKFGCLLQAEPVKKNSKIIAICMFIPGKQTQQKPKWTGTADKIRLDSIFPTSIYMLPQSSLESSKIEQPINKFALAIQSMGYFGYLNIICYCFPHKYEEQIVVWFLKVNPFYTHLQSYFDWMTFATGGSYNVQINEFLAEIQASSDEPQKKSYLLAQNTPMWNETKTRCAIVIPQLYHSTFSAYGWVELKKVLDKSGIGYDSKKKQGSNLILHDGEVKNCGIMIVISPAMTTALNMASDNLTKLHKALKCRHKSETNLLELANLFSKLSLEYQNVGTEQCI